MRSLLLLLSLSLAAAAAPSPATDASSHPVRSLTDGGGGDACTVSLGPGDCVTVALAGRPRSLSVGGGCPPEAIE